MECCSDTFLSFGQKMPKGETSDATNSNIYNNLEDINNKIHFIKFELINLEGSKI